MIARSVRELDPGCLMDLYSVPGNSSQTNRFYEDLIAFFRQRESFYGVLCDGDRYLAALRIEPFLDGVIVTGMETDPTMRRKGYATHLLGSVLNIMAREGCYKVYSHVEKRNFPSLCVHERCGFSVVLDYAVLLDGSVSNSYVTLLKIITADSL